MVNKEFIEMAVERANDLDYSLDFYLSNGTVLHCPPDLVHSITADNCIELEDDHVAIFSNENESYNDYLIPYESIVALNVNSACA